MCVCMKIVYIARTQYIHIRARGNTGVASLLLCCYTQREPIYIYNILGTLLQSIGYYIYNIIFIIGTQVLQRSTIWIIVDRIWPTSINQNIVHIIIIDIIHRKLQLYYKHRRYRCNILYTSTYILYSKNILICT